MRIQFKTEGGIAYFPGLAEPITFESSQLSPEDASELKRLLGAARFFDLPKKVGAPPRGAADYQTYTVTIEAGGRSHTVHMTDFINEAEAKHLLGFLKEKSRKFRGAGTH